MIAKAIRIDEGFKRQLFPLSPAEYAHLEASVCEEGCREKLIVWQEESILIDGHNRYDICTRNNVQFQVEFKSFANREEVEDWIDRNQAGRRNLSPDDFRIVTGRIYNRRKKVPNDGGKGKLRSGDQIDPDLRTAEVVADELGVSAPTIKRNGQRAEVYDKLVDAGETEAAEIIKQAPQAVVAEVKAMPVEQAAAKVKATHLVNCTGEIEWYTPVEFIELARDVLGQIDLDPASSEIAQKTVRAKRYYTKEIDGLSKKWKGRVWLNPPYSVKLLKPFCEKLVESIDQCEVDEAIALVNNGTETQWFQLLCDSCSAICLVTRRIAFIDPSGERLESPTHGQVFFYFGGNPSKFHDTFSSIGKCFWRNSEGI